MIRVALFDIDGTLLDTGGAGRRAFTTALEEEFGKKVGERSVLDFAGRTDLEILRTFLERFGLPDTEEGLRRRILERYLHCLRLELERTPSRGLLPGVAELLDRLAAESGWQVGLLTGNFEEGARCKLARFGIEHHFPFGAFGSDDEDRDRLVPLARDRAEALLGVPIGPDRVVVVGDTPLDIRCARAGGAAVLAVATGVFDAEALALHSPDALVSDLSGTDRVLALIGRLTDRPGGRATPRRAD